MAAAPLLRCHALRCVQVGGSGLVKFKTGDRQVPRTMTTPLSVLQTLYRYPFDRYSATLS